MRIALLPMAFLLFSAETAFASCIPDPTTLCLNDQRFRVDVRWEDFEHRTGVGKAVPLTSDTGYFWFFSDTNVELVVKVLDGRGLNQHFWVFYGALSNVAYTMTVVDTVTGRTKVYSNPSGTFGSTGDTEAFAASKTDTIASLRNAAPQETQSPCPTEPAALYLSKCRFRVEAEWKDFDGNTGGGTAIPLTADTGYFWFFNSSNVELIVKVLDGRGLNGDFWVFYGALSNVEYQLTVTDTVTGNVKTYFNPSGRFASVGDTAAFRSGLAVAATSDDARASSALISTDGGSLSSTAADGTRFTLTLPAGATLSDEQITITPITAIDGLPLSGGFRSAVQLGPEGLRLLEPATLVIDAPTPFSSGGMRPIGFGYRRTGDEFHLFPSTVTGSKAELHLMHFSGYGVGSGTDGDVAAQQQRTPASAEDRAQQDLAAGMERFAVLQAWWVALLPRLQAASDAGSFDLAFSEFLTWRSIALSEPLATPLIQAGWAAVNQGLVNAIRQTQSQCVRDPAQVQKILHLVAVAERWPETRQGDGLSVARQLVPKCLTFQLKFDSEMTITSEVVRYDARVQATVNFHLDLDQNNKPVVIPASGPLQYVTFTTFNAGCTAETQTTGSTFRIDNDPAGSWSRIEFALDFGGDLFVPQFERQPRDIRLAIDHGKPVDRVLSLTCGNPPITMPVPSGPLFWQAGWASFHGGFFGEDEHLSENLFQIRNWEFLGGRLYAQKIYSRGTPGPELPTEKTTLQLFHTPVE
jgi:hypothetical protein